MLDQVCVTIIMHKNSSAQETQCTNCPCPGSGYLTAVMGLIVGPSGRVVGVEKHPELAKQSTLNLQAAVPHLLQDGTVRCKLLLLVDIVDWYYLLVLSTGIYWYSK